MAGVPLRILEIYPKGDFFTGAAVPEMARAGRTRVEARCSLRVRLDASETLYRRLPQQHAP